MDIFIGWINLENGKKVNEMQVFQETAISSPSLWREF